MSTPASDWYLVVPLQDVDPEAQLQVMGSANVWLVNADDSDIAAQVAFVNGFPKAGVILMEYHEQPEPG